MSDTDNMEEQIYLVVANDEEQYSIWDSSRDLPLGWRDAGKTGTKAECLAFIEAAWVDMRPRSLRDSMTRTTA